MRSSTELIKIINDYILDNTITKNKEPTIVILKVSDDTRNKYDNIVDNLNKLNYSNQMITFNSNNEWKDLLVVKLNNQLIIH